MRYKWIKVIGARQPYSEGTYWMQVAEMEVLDAAGTKVSTGGTSYADGGGSYPPENAFDGSSYTTWAITDAAAGESWIAYYKATGMEAAMVRLFPYSPYNLSFVNASILGSNDSTDGVNGTWDVLATAVTMAGTSAWSEHPLAGGGRKHPDPASSHRSHPGNLSSRVFGAGISLRR